MYFLFLMKEYIGIIKESVTENKVLWSSHAEFERYQDELTRDEVLAAIRNGEIIEEYDNDKPLPSCLFCGKGKNKVIHVVLAFNNITGFIRIITVYIPDLKRWENDLRTRRK
jgi:hypothetical protein